MDSVARQEHENPGDVKILCGALGISGADANPSLGEAVRFSPGREPRAAAETAITTAIRCSSGRPG